MKIEFYERIRNRAIPVFADYQDGKVYFERLKIEAYHEAEKVPSGTYLVKNQLYHVSQTSNSNIYTSVPYLLVQNTKSQKHYLWIDISGFMFYEDLEGNLYDLNTFFVDGYYKVRGSRQIDSMSFYKLLDESQLPIIDFDVFLFLDADNYIQAEGQRATVINKYASSYINNQAQFYRINDTFTYIRVTADSPFSVDGDLVVPYDINDRTSLIVMITLVTVIITFLLYIAWYIYDVHVGTAPSRFKPSWAPSGAPSE